MDFPSNSRKQVTDVSYLLLLGIASATVCATGYAHGVQTILFAMFLDLIP